MCVWVWVWVGRCVSIHIYIFSVHFFLPNSTQISFGGKNHWAVIHRINLDVHLQGSWEDQTLPCPHPTQSSQPRRGRWSQPGSWPLPPAPPPGFWNLRHKETAMALITGSFLEWPTCFQVLLSNTTPVLSTTSTTTLLQ